MSKAMRALFSQLVPSIGSMIFCVVFLSAILIGPAMINQDGDTGRHITVGGYILDHRQIPIRDPFSHTLAGEKLTPHEWLAQVIIALAFRWLGLDGVVLWAAAMVALVIWLVYRQSITRGGLLLIALFMAMLAAAASSVHWLARPHLWTLLLLLPWVGALESIRAGHFKRWWLLPLIMLAWVNLHGAFVAGFATLFAYIVGALAERFLLRKPESGRALRWMLLAGGCSFAATLANPVGLEIWATSLGYVTNRYLVTHTNEYHPPTLTQVNFLPFALMLVLVAAMLIIRRLKIPAAHSFLLLGWAVLGLSSSRNVPVFALVAAPILAHEYSEMVAPVLRSFETFDLRLSLIEKTQRYMPWALLLVGLVTVCLSRGMRLDLKQTGNRYLPEVFPVEAADSISDRLPAGKMFNYFPWGGYLLLRLYPDAQVFIDGQTDFYGESLTRQYEQVISLSPGWEDVLETYQVNWVIMPTGEPLVGALLSSQEWHLQYLDPTATILIHE